MVSIPELYYGWTVFWVTYFVASIFFPTDQTIIRPRSNVTKSNVITRLIINCMATGAIVPLIACIPQLFILPNTWLGTLLRFMIFPLISEIWFYYMHRLMHHKYFYKWHSDHHAFIQSYALAGLYCSTIEMILVNQLSVAIPFQILGLSIEEIIFANIIVALNVLRGHAGLYFRTDLPKWIPIYVISGLDHDIHHHTLTSNYGVLYLLDRAHGTYRAEL